MLSAIIKSTVSHWSAGGGYHADTHFRCFSIMYIGWWGLVFLLPFITITMSLFILCLAIPCIFILAPVAHVNVKMSNGRKLQMRFRARAVTIGATLISIIGMLWLPAASLHVFIAVATSIGVSALSMTAAYIKSSLLTKVTQN